MASIRPARQADAAAIARVHYDAQLLYHDFYAAFLETHPRQLLPEATETALRNPQNEFIVAVTEADAVVGFVRYHVREADANGGQGKGGDDSDETGPTSFKTKEHLGALWERFNERGREMDECYERAVGGRRHVFVNHLMIDPEHQRRGIGTRLMRAVLEAEQAPVVLVSSAESVGLYGKLGFESLATWRIDNGEWARRVEEVEREMGVDGSEGLAERFRGVSEVEDLMMWVKLN